VEPAKPELLALHRHCETPGFAHRSSSPDRRRGSSELASKDLFALRLGVLNFRGFVLKKPPAVAGLTPPTLGERD